MKLVPERLKPWFRWAPPETGTVEALLQRLALAAVVFFVFLWKPLDYTDQPSPNGLAQWIDFTFLADPGIWMAIKTGLAIALILYVAGVGTPIALGIVLAIAVSFGTLRNSHGNIHHGSQATTTVILAQFIAYSIAAFRKEDRQHSPWWLTFGNVKANTRAHFYSVQAVVAGYVCAGIMKIDRAGEWWTFGYDWIRDLPNMAIMVSRNGIQHYYTDGLEAIPKRDHGLMIGNWIAENPGLARALIGPGLYIELLVVFALFNRRLAFILGWAILIMHWLIGYIMQLGFPLNEAMVWIFLVNVPFLVAWPLRRLSGMDSESEGKGCLKATTGPAAG